MLPLWVKMAHLGVNFRAYYALSVIFAVLVLIAIK